MFALRENIEAQKIGDYLAAAGAAMDSNPHSILQSAEGTNLCQSES
jgi:hypothetical protein